MSSRRWLVADIGETSRASMRAKMSAGGRGQQGVAGDDAVRVAVAGGGEIEMVGVAAAGQRHIEQLAGFLAGRDGVTGVGGDALGAVHGGGVAELDMPGHVAGGAG